MAATPTLLLEGLCDYAEANDLKKLTLHHLHLEGTTKWTQPDFKGNDISLIFIRFFEKRNQI